MRARAKVQADVEANRLYLELEGYFSPELSRANVGRIEAEIDKLAPGFVVVTDMTRLDAAPPEVTTQIASVQQRLEAAGASRVIRIVSQQRSMARMQYQRIQREAGVGYEVVEVASREEAEALLAAGT